MKFVGTHKIYNKIGTKTIGPTWLGHEGLHPMKVKPIYNDADYRLSDLVEPLRIRWVSGAQFGQWCRFGILEQPGLIQTTDNLIPK